MSDEFTDVEQTDELEDQDEVEAHKFAMTDDPDDEVEAHIRLD